MEEETNDALMNGWLMAGGENSAVDPSEGDCAVDPSEGITQVDPSEGDGGTFGDITELYGEEDTPEKSLYGEEDTPEKSQGDDDLFPKFR